MCFFFNLASLSFKIRLIHSAISELSISMCLVSFPSLSWESELQASEVSSDGYLQFLFVVLFEVKSITAHVQTDSTHLTPLGFQ